MEASALRTGAPIPRTGRLTEAEIADTRRSCLTGPAEAVAGHVAAYGEAAGGRLHLVARNYLPGMSAAGQVELLERVAREVVPLLG